MVFFISWQAVYGEWIITMAGVAEDTLSSEQDTQGTAGGSDSAVGEAAYGRRRRMRREEVVAAQLHKWYPVSPNTPHTIQRFDE
jgi:hypothetical protein